MNPNSGKLIQELDADTINVTFTGPPGEKRLAECIVAIIRQTAEEERRKCSAINIILTDDNELKRLNSKYRGINQPTDVLSFDLSDRTGVNKQDSIVPVEGDIYISLDRAIEQTRDCGEQIEMEVLRLAVHGFLHLCGWEHDDDESLQKMIEYGKQQVVSLIKIEM